MKRARGTGSIYPRGNTLWIKYTRNGVSFREPAHTSDEKEAQKLLSVRLAQCVTGTFAGLKVERIKIDELAEDFLRDYRINGHKTLFVAESRWRLHLKPFFGGMRAAHVTSRLLAQYVDERQQKGAANASINRELAALSRMFSLAYKATPKKVLQMPTFPFLKENNARQGFLEDAQFDKLVEGRELWFRALVECAATIGCRHEELKPLRVKQIDFEHKVIRLEPGTTKNKEGREAPMSNRMLQPLAACVEGKGPEDYVFTRPNGKPVRDFDYDWAKACTYAGLGNLYCNLCGGVLANSHCSECNRFRPVARHVYRGLIFHDLRRTAARNLRRAGLPESMIMKIGGWKTTSVFHRYAIVDRRDMATAMRQFEDYQQKFGHSLGTIEASEASESAAKKVQ